MLTAKDEEIDKITGLTLGADDYITKPFQPLEMVARVKAQLRRFTEYNLLDSPQAGSVIAFSGLVMDKDAHECTLNEKPLALTPTEFAILWLLASNRGRVMSAEEIFHRVWGDKYYTNSNNTVMVHIRHLREKMNDSAENPKYVKTVWGVGYKLRNRKKARGDYSRLKRKISSRMFLITASAIVIGIISYLMMVGEDSTEYVIVKGSSMMSVNSFGVFMFIIRRNKGFFLGLAVCLLILLRLFMHWFVKYFDEISAGMDQLVEETDGEITLSPELSSIEQKLNTIKGTLERQKRKAEEPNSVRMI